jgi:tetratricopeptide (TPR) repeat protein
MLPGIYKWLPLLFIWLTTVPLSAQQDSYERDSLQPHEKLYKEAVVLIDSAQYEKAYPVLKKAIKLKKNYWEAYTKMASAKIKQKDYKGALKDLNEAEKYSSYGFEIYKQKGIVYYLTEKFPESKKNLDTAVAISNDDKIEDAELFYYHALLMFAGKNYKGALSSCETAIEYNPKYVEPMMLKGEIRFAMKDYNYAIRELNIAITTMKDKVIYKAYKVRAKAKFETGDYKGAVKDWNIYIENSAKEEEAFISRAAAKINANENSSAIADLDEAIKINSRNPVSYCYRGAAKGGNGSYEEALKDLDYSIKLKFDYSTAFVNRAAIKMAKKDKRGACEDLEKADGLGNEMAIRLLEQYCKKGAK